MLPTSSLPPFTVCGVGGRLVTSVFMSLGWNLIYADACGVVELFCYGLNGFLLSGGSLNTDKWYVVSLDKHVYVFLICVSQFYFPLLALIWDPNFPYISEVII